MNYYILGTTTVVGGVMQFACNQYEKRNPPAETQVKKKKSKRKVISQFIAKNGLVTGLGVGVTAIFFKEGFILLNLKGKLSLPNNNPKVIVTSKPKSISELARSKNAIVSFFSGGLIGAIWILR